MADDKSEVQSRFGVVGASAADTRGQTSKSATGHFPGDPRRDVCAARAAEQSNNPGRSRAEDGLPQAAHPRSHERLGREQPGLLERIRSGARVPPTGIPGKIAMDGPKVRELAEQSFALVAPPRATMHACPGLRGQEEPIPRLQGCGRGGRTGLSMLQRILERERGARGRNGLAKGRPARRGQRGGKGRAVQQRRSSARGRNTGGAGRGRADAGRHPPEAAKWRRIQTPRPVPAAQPGPAGIFGAAASNTNFSRVRRLICVFTVMYFRAIRG